MTADWVVTFTFDADPSMETMDAWETQLEGFDALVSRVPGHGIDVTVYAPGDWSVFDALAKMVGEVMPVVQAKSPIAVQIISEPEHRLRAEAFTTPELMSAAEIADELGVSRQRVHQLRSTAGFPAPLADLRGGAVWDAAAVRRRGSKVDVLAHALAQLRPLPERLVMVGDRSHDVDGAAAHGIDTVVVGWGYGRADFIDKTSTTVVTHAATIDELREALGV